MDNMIREVCLTLHHILISRDVSHLATDLTVEDRAAMDAWTDMSPMGLEPTLG